MWPTKRGDGKELTLQLVADDVPVSGRIIDLEGRPVAGVTVKVIDVRVPAKASLDRWLKALEGGKSITTSGMSSSTAVSRPAWSPRSFLQ